MSQSIRVLIGDDSLELGYCIQGSGNVCYNKTEIRKGAC
jgi:hypothetical protein